MPNEIERAGISSNWPGGERGTAWFRLGPGAPPGARGGPNGLLLSTAADKHGALRGPTNPEAANTRARPSWGGGR